MADTGPKVAPAKEVNTSSRNQSEAANLPLVSYVRRRYAAMAELSMMVIWSLVTRIGDFPMEAIFSSSGGARLVFGLRSWRTRSYSISSSSRSHRIRCDCESCSIVRYLYLYLYLCLYLYLHVG